MLRAIDSTLAGWNHTSGDGLVALAYLTAMTARIRPRAGSRDTILRSILGGRGDRAIYSVQRVLDISALTMFFVHYSQLFPKRFFSNHSEFRRFEEGQHKPGKAPVWGILTRHLSDPVPGQVQMVAGDVVELDEGLHQVKSEPHPQKLLLLSGVAVS